MPPLAIAAGIAAVGTIGGALIGSRSSNNAANQANQSQQAATQSQLELGRESLGLNRDIYNSNYAMLSPFVSRGNVAGDSINALLGLPSAPTMTSPLATASGGAGGAAGTAGGSDGYYGPSMAEINAMRNDGIAGNYQAATNALSAWRSAHPGQNPFAPPAPAPAPTPTPTPTGTPAANPAAPSATDAFNQFANSAGMQFQQQQASNGLNNLYAGHGQLQSGAAMKAVPEYLQKQALNNYFMPYMGLLSGQQSTGAQAGAAIGGVGSNFGNTASGIYNGMGNAIQGGADASSNVALLRGQNNSNMWNSIGGALGSFGSSFFPSGAMASDRRLKTNITLIRRDPDGLGWYDWNWKSDQLGPIQHGVLADEVEKLRPWAHVPNFRGEYAGVNYGQLEAR